MDNRPLDSVYAHLDSLASPSPPVTPSTSFPSQLDVPFWIPLADDDPSSSTDSIVHAPPVRSHPFDFPNASPPHSFDSHFAISLRDPLADPRTRSIPPPASTSTPSLHIPLPFVSDEPYSRRSISTAPSSPSSIATRLTGLSMVRLNQPIPDSDDEGDHSDSTPGDSPPLVPSSSSQPIAGLPDSALWLLGIVVELWIDQEGFRAVKPEFILSRYFRSRTSDPLLSIAEFTPRLRQGYHFHYAPFDTPPILRRLTLNGSQTHDHITRHAQLVLKTNGVYFVQGEEDKGHLRWKFEYIVDDRRNRTGKVLGGEKMLTPLSFACSPALLSRAHGRKIKLFHEVRKRVVPKLTSLKLELPTCPPQSTHPSSATPGAKAEDESGGTLSSDEEDFVPRESPVRKRALSEGAGLRSPSVERHSRFTSPTYLTQ